MFTKKSRFHKVENTETKAENIWYFLRFPAHRYTEMCFASLLLGEAITAIVVNPQERKLAKRTCVHCKTVHLKYCPLLAFQSITMQQRMLSLFEIFASTDICRRAVRQNVH